MSRRHKSNKTDYPLTVAVIIGFQYSIDKQSNTLFGTIIDMAQAYEFAKKFNPHRIVVITDVDQDGKWFHMLNAMALNIVEYDVLNFISILRRSKIYHRYKSKELLLSVIRDISMDAERLYFYYSGHGVVSDVIDTIPNSGSGALELPIPASQSDKKHSKKYSKKYNGKHSKKYNGKHSKKYDRKRVDEHVKTTGKNSKVIHEVSELTISNDDIAININNMPFSLVEEPVLPPQHVEELSLEKLSAVTLLPMIYHEEERYDPNDKLDLPVSLHLESLEQLVEPSFEIVGSSTSYLLAEPNYPEELTVPSLSIGLVSKPQNYTAMKNNIVTKGGKSDKQVNHILTVNELREVIFKSADDKGKFLFIFDCCYGTDMNFPFMLRPDGKLRLSITMPQDCLLRWSMDKMRTKISQFNRQERRFFSQDAICLCSANHLRKSVSTNDGSWFTRYLFSKLRKNRRSLPKIKKYVDKQIQNELGSKPSAFDNPNDNNDQVTMIYSTYPDSYYLWPWLFNREHDYEIEIDENFNYLILSPVMATNMK